MRVRVCVSAPEAINNYWRDINLIRLVKQVLQLLYGTVVVIVHGCGLSIDTRRRY